MPFLGAFGAAWDDAMVASWSANRLGVLSVFAALSGGGGIRGPLRNGKKLAGGCEPAHT
jgi:hypothetical protein